MKKYSSSDFGKKRWRFFSQIIYYNIDKQPLNKIIIKIYVLVARFDVNM